MWRVVRAKTSIPITLSLPPLFSIGKKKIAQKRKVFNPVECSRKSQKRQEKKKKTKKMKEKNRCLSAKFLWHSFR